MSQTIKRVLVYGGIIIALVIFWFIFKSCSGKSFIDFVAGKSPEKTASAGDPSAQREVAYDAANDQSIQEFNLKVRKERARSRFAGDTIDLMEYVLNKYPKGTYLVDFDRTYTYNIPQSAVIYLKQSDGMYVLGLIAKSKGGEERFIEKKNVIGWDQSYIDFDSTRLGTAFFFLSLYKYAGGEFSVLWEDTVPIHGGFNRISMEMWKGKNIPYVRVNFHDARYSGHDDYNYFLINGLTSMPHRLETYDAIDRKRIFTDGNKDKFPDYYEFVYYDNGREVISTDSVLFLWSEKDTVYVNSRNPKQTRRY